MQNASSSDHHYCCCYLKMLLLLVVRITTVIALMTSIRESSCVGFKGEVALQKGLAPQKPGLLLKNLN